MNQISKSFIDNIRQIISQAQTNAIRAVNHERVLMYWEIGRHIVEEEQNGKERADYGTFLLKNLAEVLENDFGSGYSFRQLNFCWQFYLTFPIMNALRSQLNWTQYRLLDYNDKSRTKKKHKIPCTGYKLQLKTSFLGEWNLQGIRAEILWRTKDI
ncbi:DUF1016 N-terminal domain-containing protein [Algoriphagus aquimarinus]|uniref:YhcG N-terminal domain-containing protein n=1 Tax=Algoriphagus aquimarinus TaxID=237018 RepID=A0A1I0ZUI7_9BACT|nr:DUF1016 N-terminal domain-containing protein [Algoriphagus aquimarinus]SFB27883.1 Protein of unknown function [Algoriphagus aquimarinus]